MELSVTLTQTLILLGGLGLILGSFINAWVWRVEVGRKVSRGRSMCPHCLHELRWYDLVPLLSFLLLRGRCRYCHKAIAWRYPMVEALTAIIFIALGLHFQPQNLFTWLLLGLWLVLTVFLMAAASYDAQHALLPDIFTVPAIIIAVIIALIDHEAGILVHLIGAGLFTAFFGALWFFSRGRAMGDGDIRLALIMGLALAPWSLIIAIAAGFNLGAIAALGLIATGRKKRTDHIAFGPFLIAGLYVGLFFADKLRLW